MAASVHGGPTGQSTLYAYQEFGTRCLSAGSSKDKMIFWSRHHRQIQRGRVYIPYSNIPVIFKSMNGSIPLSSKEQLKEVSIQERRYHHLGESEAV